MTPAFHFQILRDFIPIFNEHAEILIEVLEKSRCQSKGEAIDIFPFMTKCALDVVCGKKKFCFFFHIKNRFAQKLQWESNWIHKGMRIVNTEI